MWAKSVAAWKMIVFASSIERAAQSGRRSGLFVEVREEGGPSTKHSGRGLCAQRFSKDPKDIAMFSCVGGLCKESERGPGL